LRSKTLNEFVRQSTIKTEADIEKAWNYAVEGSRGDVEVIVEALSNSIEITLLTVVQNNNPTLFVHQLVTDKNVAIIKKAGNPPEFQTKNYTKLKIWPKSYRSFRWPFGVEFFC
jgi:formate-dependent phosphoribosylglycinamide formyltransferase (GAR transformylase)